MATDFKGHGCVFGVGRYIARLKGFTAILPRYGRPWRRSKRRYAPLMWPRCVLGDHFRRADRDHVRRLASDHGRDVVGPKLPCLLHFRREVVALVGADQRRE